MTIKFLNIFLADDDIDDQTLFSKALQELSFPMRLSTFDNGVSLMDHLLHCPVLPDMIFLDLNMPLMNGEECLIDIKSEKKLAKIPIIIYSTSFEIYRIEELFSKGAEQYLQKPASFNALKRALKRTVDAIILGDKTNPIIQSHL
jgi:CheY-like chemotaxis protein